MNLKYCTSLFVLSILGQLVCVYMTFCASANIMPRYVMACTWIQILLLSILYHQKSLPDVIFGIIWD